MIGHTEPRVEAGGLPAFSPVNEPSPSGSHARRVNPREPLPGGDHCQSTANVDLVEDLMKSTGGWLYSKARKVAARYKLDPDDLMQELMLSLLRRRATLDDTHAGLYSWLNERIHWTAYDMLRRTKRDRETPTSPENLSAALDVRIDRTPSVSYLGTLAPPGYDPTETALSAKDLRTPGLSANEAQTVMLIWYGYDLLLKDFANLVGRSPSAIRKEKERGLRKISNQFGLTDQEFSVFTAWRACGSTSAAARNINMTDSDVLRIVRDAHKKIHAVFDRRLSPAAYTGSGPWLVVYGRGLESEDVALHVRAQCVVRGIDSALRPIDETAQIRVGRFAGLVAVLPSELDADPLVELRPFKRLIQDYRAGRPEGIDSILNGSCEWFDAGVVQIIGRRAIMRHPTMKALLNRVCAQHDTEDSTPLNVFEPYETRKEQRADDVYKEGIEHLWLNIQTWGISEISIVPELRKCIDSCRHHYEDGRFRQLHRPISGLSRNRLDIILDGPCDVVVGNQKTWMENGARVWRHVEKELRKIDSNFRRPVGDGNKRNAQEQLREFYFTLRTVESYMRLSGEPDSLSF
jgi:RNA polymerase sigma factor (sigma-70 family)